MKKFFYTIIAFVGTIIFSSCGNMMDVDNDSIAIEPELSSKTDSVFYALGIAQAMQQVADQYFFIGEMRGELVSPTSKANTNLRQLSNYSADVTNAYDSAYVFYKVINNCNYYLAHRDTTLYTGGENVTINEYAAVAAWRAWAYLQLARTYCGNAKEGIPFFTEPITAISQINEDNFPKKNLTEIVAELAPELEKYSGLDVPTFGQATYGIGTTNWGNTKTMRPSKIFIPVDVILGEMYLEDAQYQRAAQHYATYLCDNSLMSEKYNSVRYGEKEKIKEMKPEDFCDNYQNNPDNYKNIFGNNITDEIITYIPMAVSSQMGTTTNVPLAFGHDYYSTERSGNCPRVENIQIMPSNEYYSLTNDCDYYYYPQNWDKNTLQSFPNEVKSVKWGDGRANIGTSKNSNEYMLNRSEKDTSLIYIRKVVPANIIVYRVSTIYLHLAEAMNRMGYPDAAFAVLKNGISTYLEELAMVEELDINGDPQPIPDYKYIEPKTVTMLRDVLPFLNVENRSKFIPENTFGIHSHGGGTANEAGSNNKGGYLEDGITVYGSRATAVGSIKNLEYMPKPIIGKKMAEIADKYGVAVGTTPQDTINAMELVLCDEYAKEFAFEGTRFYDLQRMARHLNENGAFGGNFGSLWISRKLQGNQPTVNLTNPKNWYLPFK